MSNLTLEVFTGSAQAFNVKPTIVYGEKDAVLVDLPNFCSHDLIA